MSRTLNTTFGRPGLKYISSGLVNDESSVTLTFEPGCSYMLITKEWNASTGAYRGHRANLIAVPEENLFGTTAVTRGAMYASTNAGVSITNNSDSTVTLARSSATYAFRYTLYRLDSAASEWVEPPVEAYTGEYEVDPTFTLQTLETAGKRMEDDVSINAIEVSTASNPQGGNTVYIGGTYSNA